MILQALAFYVFAAITVAAAAMVVVSRNPVYSVLFLILAFFNAAALFLLIGAEFIAMILVIVYVGAVAVLFLFVVMMLDVDVEKLRQGFTRYAPLGALIALVVMAQIGLVVYVRKLGLADTTVATTLKPEGYSNTLELGHLLYTQYLYPFEIAAVILLVAIVAAITLTMRDRPGQKIQDIGKQVAVRARDRVRVVKMDAEPKQ